MDRDIRHRCWKGACSSLANKGSFVPAGMPIYHPREPSNSPLWKILHNHYEDFKAGYDEHCEKQYGFFRPVVDDVVEEYLRCGDLHEACPEVSKELRQGSPHQSRMQK